MARNKPQKLFKIFLIKGYFNSSMTLQKKVKIGAVKFANLGTKGIWLQEKQLTRNICPKRISLVITTGLKPRPEINPKDFRAGPRL